jgi:hypothetical protein
LSFYYERVFKGLVLVQGLEEQEGLEERGALEVQEEQEGQEGQEGQEDEDLGLHHYTNVLVHHVPIGDLHIHHPMRTTAATSYRNPSMAILYPRNKMVFPPQQLHWVVHRKSNESE